MPDAPSSTPNIPLGFGCSGAWGQKWFSEDKAIDLVHQAIRLGITHFDTGNFYQQGRAETRLGMALRSAFNKAMIERPALTIATKTGTQIAANGGLVKDFSRDTIFSDVETSLNRLSLDALDILYMHGPNEHELFSSLPIFDDLKTQGLIHATGICTDGSQSTIAAAAEGVDVLMAPYNILNRDHAASFSLAKKNGKKTVAIAAMAQGLYKKSLILPKSPADLWYLARAVVKNRPEWAKARAAGAVLDVPGWTRAEVALAFCLANDSIDIAMTTTTRQQNMVANVTASQKQLPAEMIQLLQDLPS